MAHSLAKLGDPVLLHCGRDGSSHSSKPVDFQKTFHSALFGITSLRRLPGTLLGLLHTIYHFLIWTPIVKTAVVSLVCSWSVLCV